VIPPYLDAPETKERYETSCHNAEPGSDTIVPHDQNAVMNDPIFHKWKENTAGQYIPLPIVSQSEQERKKKKMR
jgi:hypothetical protein